MARPRLFPGGRKTILGVVHLGHLLGQAGFAGQAELERAAAEDARLLVENGCHALLIENWKDESPGPFVGPEVVASLVGVGRAVLVAARGAPVGVNVLPNDYRAAFALARSVPFEFVQLDVLVDPVRTDYSYSTAPPFEVRVDRADLAAWRARLGAAGVTLLATIHPKHYALLEPRTLDGSAREALAWGADAVVVTGAVTGKAPDPVRVATVRRALGPDALVVVGSGLDASNAAALLEHADGAIVGTALRAKDLGAVVPEKVRAVLRAAGEAR